jgi:hypothetical protein
MHARLEFVPLAGVVILGLSLVACAKPWTYAPVSPTEVPKLAGFWKGYFVGTSGAGEPADMTIERDGRYAIVFPSGTTMEGRISVTNGQLVLTNDYLSGPAVDLAEATATLSLHQKGKRQHLLGFGENDAGPFSFSFGR